jgi:hypothetical protein
MNAVSRRPGFSILVAALLTTIASAQPATAAEVFTATATVKTADGKTGTAPITITIDRMMPEKEAAPLVAAFKSGGADAFRKALVGVAPTGSVKVGAGKAIPTRISVERATGGGRLVTIVTDQTLVFIGGAAPNAKPKAGYDYAIVDLILDANNGGTGTVAPAAKLKLNGDAFVVEDYSGEVVRLSAIKKTK